MDLKENYALNHRKKLEQSLNLNKRLFNTYNRITKKKTWQNVIWSKYRFRLWR